MTANNHPAHGPVSLDRLHQIREILSKASAQSDGGNLGYAMADAVKVIDGAIAEFSAEPVAIAPVMYKGIELLKKDGLELIRDGIAEATELESMCMAKALLSAQPAPVVSEWTNEQCLEFLSIAFRHAEIKGDLELDDIRLGMKMVNESRASMLQAGNSPVIPDGWVACSERLPEETKEPDGGATGYLVLYAKGKEPNGGFSVGVWNVTYLRQWWRGFITHWMPLPAAPHFREISNSSTNNFRENVETSTKCWCRTCRPVTMSDMRFVVCPDCGNKRCPHANDHRNACTGSNEPGQIGSAYPAAPQQEAE